MAGHGNEKQVIISINSKDFPVPHEKISYKTVVDLFYGEGASVGAAYLVKYSRGASDNVSGILPTDGEVMVKDGMQFRISSTGES